MRIKQQSSIVKSQSLRKSGLCRREAASKMTKDTASQSLRKSGLCRQWLRAGWDTKYVYSFSRNPFVNQVFVVRSEMRPFSVCASTSSRNPFVNQVFVVTTPIQKKAGLFPSQSLRKSGLCRHILKKKSGFNDASQSLRKSGLCRRRKINLKGNYGSRRNPFVNQVFVVGNHRRINLNKSCIVAIPS